jgi:hypothetical protein
MFAGAAFAKKGRFYERNQYFSRSAHRAVHDPAAPMDAQTQTAISWVSITNDVPVLRIDHIPTKGALLGVWQAAFRPVLDFQEMNCRLVQIVARKDIGSLMRSLTTSRAYRRSTRVPLKVIITVRGSC